ncbi:MAG: saccharopine dehydrogenase, partial [Anaerolineae bacterium]|nr:saccharopine dehydrogenase [Anaerolineae bacterium]
DVTALSVPWGDVATAYRTTGIRNIRAFMATPGPLATLAKVSGPLIRPLLKNAAIRRGVGLLASRFANGPTYEQREEGQVFLWARASNDAGETKQAWMATPEVYRFTAEIAIAAVEQVMAQQPIGATTPALAFGEDFAFSVEGVERADAL